MTTGHSSNRGVSRWASLPVCHGSCTNVAATGIQKTAQYQTGPHSFVVAYYIPYGSVGTGQYVIDNTASRYTGHRIAGWGGEKDYGRDATWQNLAILSTNGPMNMYVVDALAGPDGLVFWVETVKTT